MATSHEQGCEEGVRMLLDGLAVESIRELRELVTDGKYYRFMLNEGFSLVRADEDRRIIR